MCTKLHDALSWSYLKEYYKINLNISRINTYKLYIVRPFSSKAGINTQQQKLVRCLLMPTLLAKSLTIIKNLFVLVIELEKNISFHIQSQ